MPRPYPPDFEAVYQEVFTTPDGVAIPKSQREKTKSDTYEVWKNRSKEEIPEAPIALPSDTQAEALEKIVQHSLKSMTPTDAVKHRAQLLKFAGDTVLLDRKAKIEKQALASGLSIITELFRQVASGEVKQGPGWVDAIVLPTLSATEQAEVAVSAAENLSEPSRGLTAQQEAV